MRYAALLAGLGLFACGDGGGGRGTTGDARPNDAQPGDAQPDPPPDAPPAPADARPRPPADCTEQAGAHVTLRRIAAIEESGGALLVTSPPYDPRLFVVMQAGQIRIIEDEVLLPVPFLDVSGLVAQGSEQGLLGLAFHPDYERNRTFFVYYATADANVLARYTAADRDAADPDSAEVLLSIADRVPTHNGGMIEFGADGYLYVGTGDGGGRSDPDDNAEDPSSLFGKILRLDVDRPAGGLAYGIPPDNPFAARGGAPEVFMLGLRNPWRWSFDENRDMYIGDVGFRTYEELNIVPAGQGAGWNFGWDHIEGNGHCNEPATGCDTTGTVLPVYEWPHDPDPFCAIVGGAVYRGGCYPDLVGTYVFSDYCAGVLWGLRAESGAIVEGPAALPATRQRGFASVHASATGELYATTTTGLVFHVEAGPAPAP